MEWFSLGTPILVPLTPSLYVPGQLASTAVVLVDVGTGFFVEKVTVFLFSPIRERYFRLPLSTRRFALCRPLVILVFATVALLEFPCSHQPISSAPRYFCLHPSLLSSIKS